MVPILHWGPLEMKLTPDSSCKDFFDPFLFLAIFWLGFTLSTNTGAMAQGDEKFSTEPGTDKTVVSSPPQITFYCGFQSPHSDILNARIKEAFGRMGYAASLIALPSQRALFLANSEGDGDFSRVSNIKQIAPDNTDNLIMVPEESLVAELAVFTKGLEFPVEGWGSLEPYRNGARIGAKILEKNVPGERTFLALNSQLFQMLDAGRLDTVVEWRLSGQKAVRDLGLTEIRALETPIVTVKFYPFIHKKHERLVEQLAKELQGMKLDGSFDKLAEPWLR